MIISVMCVSFFLLVGLGMPIAFAVGIGSALGLLMDGTSMIVLASRMFRGVDSFTLAAIPLFVFAGDVMLHGNLTRILVAFSDIFVGRIRGGLGHINILASIFFAGITGSAAADTSAIGSVLIPSMVEKDYPQDYSTAITIASSVIGPIIPPSLTFVIYSLSTRVSIGGLFMAGLLPGLLTGAALMGLHYYISKKRNYEKRSESLPWSTIIKITRKSLLIIVMPLIIIMGVLSGVYTATEAAAVACVYGLLLSIVVFRTLKISQLPHLLFNTAKVSAVIALLLATSNIFTWALTMQNFQHQLGEFLLSLTSNPMFFLLLVNILFLIVGCVVDTFPAILIFAPIFHPIAIEYGIHPLHFGVIMCVNLLIGLNTPPIGTGLFLGAAIGKVPLESLIKAVTPFLLIELFTLLVITYLPIVTLWVPKLTGFL